MSEKHKIVVLGDSGVGKTSLVHMICHGTPLKAPSWTLGVNLDVLKFSPLPDVSYEVEIWDVGGRSKYERSRNLYYESVEGVVLVHDLSNRKSYVNLKKWLKEIARSLGTDSSFSWGQSPKSGRSLPVLVIGNKCDLTTPPIADEEQGMGQLFVNSLDGSHFGVGSLMYKGLCHFLGKVTSANKQMVYGSSKRLPESLLSPSLTPSSTPSASTPIFSPGLSSKNNTPKAPHLSTPGSPFSPTYGWRSPSGQGNVSPYSPLPQSSGSGQLQYHSVNLQKKRRKGSIRLDDDFSPIVLSHRPTKQTFGDSGVKHTRKVLFGD